MNKGQLSTETLVLIGLMLAIMVPLLVYSYQRANIVREDLSMQKAEFAVGRLAAISDSVGYLGPDAAIVEEIEVPPHATRLEANGRDIVMTVVTSSGTAQVVKPSAFELEEEGLENIIAGGTYFVEARAVELEGGAQKVRLKLS